MSAQQKDFFFPSKFDIKKTPFDLVFYSIITAYFIIFFAS